MMRGGWTGQGAGVGVRGPQGRQSQQHEHLRHVDKAAFMRVANWTSRYSQSRFT